MFLSPYASSIPLFVAHSAQSEPSRHTLCVKLMHKDNPINWNSKEFYPFFLRKWYLFISKHVVGRVKMWQYLPKFHHKTPHFLNELSPSYFRRRIFMLYAHFFTPQGREKFLCEKINRTIADRKFLLYLHSILRHESATYYSNMRHK